MVLRVHLLAGQLEGSRLPGLASLLIAHSQLVQESLLARSRLVLHLHVSVEGDERAVLELAQRVDLGKRHVVVKEQAGQTREDGGQPVERRARGAKRGDQLLGLPVLERRQRGEVGAGHVVWVLLGHLLDIDATHVGEQHHGALADPIPDHAGVVLVLDGGLRVDQDAARHVSVDLEIQDPAGMALGLLGRVGELDASGLHAPACQHLRLDHHGARDFSRNVTRFLGGLRESVLCYRDTCLRDDRAGLVLEEAHQRRGRLAEGPTPRQPAAR